MRIIALIPFFLIFSSCKEVVGVGPDGNDFYFLEPQPVDDSEVSKFPSRFRGLFMRSDSVYLEIDEKIIFQKSINSFRIHNNALDSIKDEFTITGNQYVVKINDEVYYRKDIGDSIQFSAIQKDTFFVFSDRKKAKYISNHLILNTKDSAYWKIKILQLEKDVLKLKYIYSDEDLKKIDSITKIKSQMIDSASYIIKPSRREFKKMLKLKELGSEEQFKRVSK